MLLTLLQSGGAGVTGNLAAQETGSDGFSAEGIVRAPVSGGAGDYGPAKKKRRFVVEIDGKLVVFANKADALAALNQKDAEEKPEQVQTAQPVKAPLFSVSLDDVRQLAAEREALGKFQAQLQAMRYETLLRFYEEMRDEQDIEDLLMLL